MSAIPSFDQLPIDKDGPFLNAWGLYGRSDQLGFLNRLTDQVVKEAATEIKTGTRVSMNWPLDTPHALPFFGRQAFHQHMYAKSPRCVNDDVWTFNSQSSSQWDGLRHFAYQKEQKFYNGVTMADIHNTDNEQQNPHVNGIGAWSEKGIVGRGILIDYESWHQTQTPPRTHDAFSAGSISLADLKAVLAHQNTTPKFGDILLIRSGYMAQYASKTHDDLARLTSVNPPSFFGVEQSEDVLRWIWETFSAVAADHPSFECWPSQRKEFLLHEVLLSGWGCPIGELFDLERLALQCKEAGRYSFFVSSEPCNVRGGVASPPNILAIF
ncbi:hypothetical protein AAFC00_006774 [Neodothiora populina]|uniref:Cyclase n=1 Tax=Neodothiora populina TaxID=2781224 RepID=A0ABR3PBI3_9PEZI